LIPLRPQSTPYRLTPAGNSYLLDSKYIGRLAVTEPVRLDIDVSQLFQR
jgi:hypothetical protein